MLVAASSAYAAHAPCELVLDRTAIPPGGKATVAVVFKIQPEWHLYWLNPGAAGAPPKVKWDLPPGVIVGDLQFPVPKRKSLGGLTAFVYEKEVALLADVTLPADAKGSVELKAHVKVVVCADACVLEEQDVSLRIAVRDGEPNAVDRFATWRAQQPRRASPLKIVASHIDADKQHGRLSVELPAGQHGVEFFPPRTRFLKVDGPTPHQTPNASHTFGVDFEILPDPPAEFSGPGLVVTKDAAGNTSAEEMTFTFQFANP